MVKTIKLAISLIDENKISYKDLCEELFQMQYLSAKACNRVMSYLYADKQQEFIMKDANMDIPTPKEMYGKSRMSYINDKLKEIMTTSYSGNISQTRSFVENQFSKDVKKGLFKGNVSLTNFKRTGAISLHNKSYKLFETDKEIAVSISTSKNLEESSLVQIPLLAYDKGKNKSKATQDYLALTEYILEKG